jgi:hypothetical protein
MISYLVEALFGCSHSNYSFPRTVRRGERSPAAAVTGTYVVCLKCGKELPYDWKQMKVIAMPAEPSSTIGQPIGSYVGK